MVTKALKKVFGNRNDRELKRMQSKVDEINSWAHHFEAMCDDELRNQTHEFRNRFGEENLDDLLPEAFAAVREAATRANNTRHFDVQLLGGITLHEGKIAEMRTGEGKTLVATLAAYLNAIPGDGVHVVTVNDYLARRDAEWMGPVYRALGMTVGVIQSRQEQLAKREAYMADITYGTNNEFGFDYLRDNMAFRLTDRYQRRLNFAIVDEVDSILIDEARTPLIISGPADDNTELYQQINRIAPRFEQQDPVDDKLPKVLGGGDVEDTGDFFIEPKHRSVELTERGHGRVEEFLRKADLLGRDDSLYAPGNLQLLHHVTVALKAHFLYKRDVEYMVKDREVIIIDEHTGRAMPGRRWSEGIHQAIEAKEGVPIRHETQTMASTTFQNYFRLYSKLSGMTGTADTEAFEFKQIYDLDVIVIPTHLEMIRDDRNDVIYMSLEEKYDAIVEDICDCRDAGRPVLIGTTSIDSSERLSRELRKRKIQHNVLNAKQHEREADIVAEAGRPGKVTIATNMAGRGTDIVLGGSFTAEISVLGDEPEQAKIDKIMQQWNVRHQQVIDAGGLHIIGTERHESRRIDNQLRGRSGRQGDPGSSRFYLSMEDDLLRRFASERWNNMVKSLGLQRGEAIQAKMVNNAIERAQRRVEGQHFDVRKNLLEYDDVANDQRQVIYAQRNELMYAQSILPMIEEIRADVLDDVISEYIAPGSLPDQWEIGGLEQVLQAEFGIEIPISEWIETKTVDTEQDIRDKVAEIFAHRYSSKRHGWIDREIEADTVEKQVMLMILDKKWKEHLYSMDHLRQGIHLRAYAQKQPKQEYKRESFHLFQNLLQNVQHESIRMLTRMDIKPDTVIRKPDRESTLQTRKEINPMLKARSRGPDGQRTEIKQPYVREQRKVGRNEPCTCGSGKKFKHCCGAIRSTA
ncbi:MAG: preprotein translocase subunit SecA [Gammaproteobacteria bacterium]|nr:preprotein translocase subunit SecA [Gammaproteobacteria bacterium]MDE0252376.1 preprotein translocase subunit SecA [Gammaproteobacteria bacterium]MDE0402515.1 preprotein translocase subunit SecA [Gammaproteobacteria bacterium]